MQIHLSRQDGVPTYLQIVNQIKYLVAAGRLKPGEELPPIRVLAQRLVINPNTVARAYRELETAGVVTKKSTTGTYVSDAGSPLARRERLKILTERIDALLVEALERAGRDSVEAVTRAIERRTAKGASVFRALVEAYLSDEHLASPETGCPVAALAGDYLDAVTRGEGAAAAERYFHPEIVYIVNGPPSRNHAVDLPALSSELRSALP